jgi:protoporphyrinogen oxidase
LIAFVDELGLTNHLEWQRTYTGFFVDDRMHSISSNLEFLKFPLLSLMSKARLAWTRLYCSRIDDWKSLENVTVEDWLIASPRKSRQAGKPLLFAKLGPNYKRVSAVFIGHIVRLFGTRQVGER